jgi:hypothetical protein
MNLQRCIQQYIEQADDEPTDLVNLSLWHKQDYPNIPQQIDR